MLFLRNLKMFGKRPYLRRETNSIQSRRDEILVEFLDPIPECRGHVMDSEGFLIEESQILTSKRTRRQQFPMIQDLNLLITQKKSLL